MPSTPRLGLRAQIVLALSLVFLLAVWSLGFVTLQITRRSAEVSLTRSERNLAHALAPVLERTSFAPPEFEAVCRGLRDRASVAGMRVVFRDGSAHACGTLKRATGVPLASGGELFVSLNPPRDSSGASFVNLLLFYMAITG